MVLETFEAPQTRSNYNSNFEQCFCHISRFEREKKCLNSQNNLDEKSSFDGINSFEIRFRQKYNTEIALTKT